MGCADLDGTAAERGHESWRQGQRRDDREYREPCRAQRTGPGIDGVSAALVTGASLADHAGDLAVVAAWGVVGAVFAVRGFSWHSKRD